MGRVRVATVLAAVLLLGGVGLLPVRAQMTPDAPVLNFRLPMFDEATGIRTWELRGAEGIYRGGDRILVKDMTLRVFVPGSGTRVESTIASPEAVVAPAQRIARGEGAIRVDAPSFTLEGEKWTWEGRRNRIVVRERARVVFLEELDALLR